MRSPLAESIFKCDARVVGVLLGDDFVTVIIPDSTPT